MIFLVAVGVLFAGYGTAYLASEDVRYVTRAGLEESRILRDARPLDELVAHPGIKPEFRASLGLVRETRDYAAELGLAAKQTYTTFTDVGRDTLLLNLSAAPKDCICASHLEVSDRRAHSLQGVLRFREGPARGRPPRRPRLRHLPPAGRGVLDPRLVQRSAALYRAHP